MEVHHKPQPWHGVREFLKEYAIVVLGVLTALVAEQVVEKLRQHEQATLAEHAMRLELGEDDGPQAFGRVIIAPCLEARIAQIHDGAATASGDQLRAWTSLYAPPYRSWDAEAWKALSASNVAGYLGPEKLIGWSAAYRVVPGLNENNTHETELLSQLRDATPPSGELSAADRQHVREVSGQLRMWNDRISRGSELFLSRIRGLDAPVPAATQKSLLVTARAIYGNCVRGPNLTATPGAMRPEANVRGFMH